jgi:hypothetical protein
MLDRIGNEVKVGDLVTIVNHPEVELKYNWIIEDFIDYSVTIDAVLSNFITHEVRFIAILDIIKEF